MNVADYLDAATRRPWIYGGGPGGFRGHDCTLFLANWVMAVSGRDPADDLRETYSTREEAEAIVHRARGFVPLIGARVATLGWRGVRDANDAKPGDIAVVSLSLGRGQHFKGAAVFFGGKWTVADPRRLIPLPKSVFCEAIWRRP